jgi:aminoglycoside/choline kinase family phosphotransferase
LGVYNTDEKENQAFVEFTNSFAKAGLPVPEVYAFEPDNHLYLLQDLGDTTLFAFLQGIRKNDAFPDELMTFYEKTLAQLVQFQTQGSKCIDYGIAILTRHSTVNRCYGTYTISNTIF